MAEFVEESEEEPELPLTERRLFDGSYRDDQQIRDLVDDLVRLEPVANEEDRRLIVDTLDDLAEEMIGRRGTANEELRARIMSERARFAQPLPR